MESPERPDMTSFCLWKTCGKEVCQNCQKHLLDRARALYCTVHYSVLQRSPDMKTKQTVAIYKGTPITELSRDDLLIALDWAFRHIEALRQAGVDDLEVEQALKESTQAFEESRKRIDR